MVFRNYSFSRNRGIMIICQANPREGRAHVTRKTLAALFATEHLDQAEGLQYMVGKEEE
jgi:hypothetical protein